MMTEFVDHELELARSIDFFTNPSSYKDFRQDQNLLHILGCIDRRDQISNRLHTVVQTPGAAIGEGTDAALALSVITGKPVTVLEGIASDRSTRHTLKLCAHHDCQFVHSLSSILEEMTAPQPFTVDSVDRWTQFHELGEDVTPGVLKAVQGAAEQMLDQPHDESTLVEFVDSLYPTPNVATMVDEVPAKIYMVNLHPTAGLNRHKLHRVAQLSMKGYHDSLGATIADLRASRLKPELLSIRLSAHILKAAAVRTVITGAHVGIICLEGQMTEHGLQVHEITYR